ncbi:MAG TPA: DUF503 domain-containing protein [Myxococcota bacterium]|nr:DUF503 domain-containing protein [Myxococcota bacterium]
MVVGVVRLVLRIPGNDSLKGKRKVIKQIIERTRGRFSLAVAECGLNDNHRQAELGLACVGNDRRTCNSVLDRAVGYIDSLGTALIIDRELEIINL